jgi:small multidrug resistance family-3 protein
MKSYISTFFILFIASIFELVGSFGLWMWMKQDKSILFVIPGTIFLVAFVYLMTTIDSEYAGKLYALYSGIYLLASIGWMWLFEGNAPSKFDVMGIGSYLFGSIMIFYGERIFQ